MFVADMHCDSLSNVNSSRGLRNKYNFSIDYPQLQFVAEFVPNRGESAEMRRKRLMHYLDVYISETARLKIVGVRNCHDLNFAVETEQNASILSIEGGGGLFADSEELNTLYRMGMRVMGLAWDRTELAASSFDRDDTGLTDEGRRMVDRLGELGVIIDVSHLSDRSFYEVMERTAYPVIATHSNFREICDNPRNLTLEMAKKIALRGGVIGLNLYPSFLTGGDTASLADLERHVDYALDKLGEDCLGFGFDIDGTDGKYPVGIDETDSIHDRVIEVLDKRYGGRIVEKLAGRNVIDFLRGNL